MKTVIYYATPNPDEIRRIRREYGLPDGMNVNGETECNLSTETLERLQEEIRRGTVQVRRKPDIKPPTPIAQRNRYISPPRPRNTDGSEKKPKRRTPVKRKPADVRQTNMFNSKLTE